MKAPDRKAPYRIYLQQYDTDTVISLNKYNIDEEWTEVPLNVEVAKDIEYIRKDIVDETIKTAEDHAYFAGQEKFREKLIEWAKENIDSLGWHSVDESLPPMDEEVIVLLDEWNEVRIEPLYRIAFGHIVNKEYCEDFSGWNIPGVSYWMPMPEIPKEEKK